jgi:hypothetical protein
MIINPVSSLLSTLQTPSAALSSPASSIGTSGAARSIDASSISPTASFLNELSQMQQQNPRQFSQVLSRITSRLSQAAQTAAKNGDTQKAAQFSQLAASLKSAASGGKLPTAQQLQQAGLITAS